MYDIHCHILPGVDDGPSSMETAVEMAQAAEQAGIGAVVCTPHYIEGEYNNKSECNLGVLNSFKAAVELKGISVKLYLGNEIYITPDIIRLIDTNIVCTLNNSRYILIELPIHNKPLYIEDVLFKLKLRGLVPVIAHPERYEWVARNPKEFSSILDNGCLAQLNMASIRGYYRRRVKNTAKALVKEGLIHLLGSDTHASNKIYNGYKTDMKLLKRISSEYHVNQIIENAEAVIKNQIVKSVL